MDKKTITASTEYIAACGLYCGACRKYLNGSDNWCITGIGIMKYVNPNRQARELENRNLYPLCRRTLRN